MTLGKTVNDGGKLSSDPSVVLKTGLREHGTQSTSRGALIAFLTSVRLK